MSRVQVEVPDFKVSRDRRASEAGVLVAELDGNQKKKSLPPSRGLSKKATRLTSTDIAMQEIARTKALKAMRHQKNGSAGAEAWSTQRTDPRVRCLFPPTRWSHGGAARTRQSRNGRSGTRYSLCVGTKNAAPCHARCLWNARAPCRGTCGRAKCRPCHRSGIPQECNLLAWGEPSRLSRHQRNSHHQHRRRHRHHNHQPHLHYYSHHQPPPQVESYKFYGEESRIHYERRMALNKNYTRTFSLIIAGLVFAIAITIAFIDAFQV